MNVGKTKSKLSTQTTEPLLEKQSKNTKQNNPKMKLTKPMLKTIDTLAKEKAKSELIQPNKKSTKVNTEYFGFVNETLFLDEYEYNDDILWIMKGDVNDTEKSNLNNKYPISITSITKLERNGQNTNMNSQRQDTNMKQSTSRYKHEQHNPGDKYG